MILKFKAKTLKKKKNLLKKLLILYFFFTFSIAVIFLVFFFSSYTVKVKSYKILDYLFSMNVHMESIKKQVRIR